MSKLITLKQVKEQMDRFSYKTTEEDIKDILFKLSYNKEQPSEVNEVKKLAKSIKKYCKKDSLDIKINHLLNLISNIYFGKDWNTARHLLISNKIKKEKVSYELSVEDIINRKVEKINKNSFLIATLSDGREFWSSKYHPMNKNYSLDNLNEVLSIIDKKLNEKLSKKERCNFLMMQVDYNKERDSFIDADKSLDFVKKQDLLSIKKSLDFKNDTLNEEQINDIYYNCFEDIKESYKRWVCYPLYLDYDEDSYKEFFLRILLRFNYEEHYLTSPLKPKGFLFCVITFFHGRLNMERNIMKQKFNLKINI